MKIMKHVLSIGVITLVLIIPATTIALDCDKVYKGTYVWGNDADIFRPCTSDNSYWISTQPSIHNQLTNFYRQHPTTSPYEPVYIEFRGHLLNEKVDDFAVNYDGLIRISELRVQSVDIPDTCTSHIVPYQCLGDYFPTMQKQATWGKIIGKKGWRSYFYDDGKHCPYRTSCKRKAYLIPGDQLIVGKIEDGWACVWYPSRRGGLVGWMDMEHIRLQSSIMPKNDDWSGTWIGDHTDAEITIEYHKDGLVHVEGTAIWEGANGVVHDGYFSTTGRIQGDRLTVDQNMTEDCKVKIRLLNNYLMVADNQRCGGMNVSFSDIYKKSPGKK